MYINIESVTVTPKRAVTGEKVLITIKVQESTYGRLQKFVHRFLARFTHKQLREDVIEKP